MKAYYAIPVDQLLDPEFNKVAIVSIKSIKPSTALFRVLDILTLEEVQFAIKTL